VNYVKVEFDWPADVLPNTISIGNWFYGGVRGCNDKDQLGYPGEVKYQEIYPKAIFKFSEAESSTLEEQISGALVGSNQNQYGWVEFCVEFRTNPSNILVNLQPAMPFTYFDGIQYPINTFIDPCDKCSRTIKTEKNCNCNCKTKVILSPTQPVH